MATYYLKRGDVGHVFRDTLTAETAVNLAGATVRFVMAEMDGTSKIAGAATVENNTGPAQVAYTCTTGDVDTAGRYRAEWEVTYAGGAVQSFPNDGHVTVIITEDLD